MKVPPLRKRFFRMLYARVGNNETSTRASSDARRALTGGQRGGHACILLKTQPVRGHRVGTPTVRTISPSPQHRDWASSAPLRIPIVRQTSESISTARLSACLIASCQAHRWAPRRNAYAPLIHKQGDSARRPSGRRVCVLRCR